MEVLGRQRAFELVVLELDDDQRVVDDDRVAVIAGIGPVDAARRVLFVLFVLFVVFGLVIVVVLVSVVVCR
ncbi:MAG: hypothetical protein OEV40_21435 [Acidimicrobiia bacterium]|nr:hypothetical protein [Acidimicrobiia bacterium]